MADQDRAARIARIQRIERIRALEGGDTQQPVEQSQEESGAAEAALQGAGQGISFGYLPEIQAGVYQAGEEIANKLGANIPSETYEESLKAFRDREKKLQEESPVAYGAGSVAGALAVPIPGGGAAKSASLLARTAKALGKGALVGGTMAGLQNVDENTPSLMKNPEENLKQRAKNAAQGALIGGALSGAGQLASDVLPQALEKSKSYLAAKTMGLSGQSSKAEKLIKDKKLGKLADFMDESGMLKPGQNPDTVLEKTKTVLNQTGREIGKTYDDISKQIPKEGLNLENATPDQIKDILENGSINPKELSEKLLQDAKDMFDQGRMDEGTLNAITKEASMLSKRQNDIKDVLDYRMSLDDRLNKIYKKPMADMTEKEEALLTVRRTLKDKLDKHINAIDKFANTKETQKLKQLNDTYSKASDIKNVAEKYVIKGQTKNLLGLPELIVGGAAGGAAYDSNDPLASMGKGLLTGVAYGAARKYGPGISYGAMKGANKTAQALNKSPYLATKALVSPWIQMQNKENK